MLRIGDFSKLSRISIRMLRHYDETGILHPESVDGFTGYRYYSEAQLPLAGEIQVLKSLGFGLSTIKEILGKYEEIVRKENEITIGIHIPSDADFSPSAVDRSLENARRFFSQYYPETEGAEYCCESWLLDGQLRGMVRENANIVSFQNRFEILDEGTAGTDFIEWVFHRNSADTDYAEFPENTSLQRNLKRHLLAGGVIRNAHGKILANHV